MEMMWQKISEGCVIFYVNEDNINEENINEGNVNEDYINEDNIKVYVKKQAKVLLGRCIPLNCYSLNSCT